MNHVGVVGQLPPFFRGGIGLGCGLLEKYLDFLNIAVQNLLHTLRNTVQVKSSFSGVTQNRLNAVVGTDYDKPIGSTVDVEAVVGA